MPGQQRSHEGAGVWSGIEEEHARPGIGRFCRRRCALLQERHDGGFFVGIDTKHRGELGDLQQLDDERRRRSQPQVATTSARVPQKAHDQPHAGTVDIIHLAQVQYQAAELAQPPLQGLFQQRNFLTGDDAAGTANDIHRSDMTRFQNQGHAQDLLSVAR